LSSETDSGFQIHLRMVALFVFMSSGSQFLFILILKNFILISDIL
jgi:hypothetical protein